MVNIENAVARGLIEVVQENSHTFEGFLLLALNLDGKLDFGFGHTAQIGQRLQIGHQTDALTRKNSLSELHLLHAIVDHHLQVVHLDDLAPQVRQHRKSEIPVRDGAVEGLSTLARSVST